MGAGHTGPPTAGKKDETDDGIDSTAVGDAAPEPGKNRGAWAGFNGRAPGACRGWTTANRKRLNRLSNSPWPRTRSVIPTRITSTDGWTLGAMPMRWGLRAQVNGHGMTIKTACVKGLSIRWKGSGSWYGLGGDPIEESRRKHARSIWAFFYSFMIKEKGAKHTANSSLKAFWEQFPRNHNELK